MARGSGQTTGQTAAEEILYGQVGRRDAAEVEPLAQEKRPSLHLGKLQARVLEAVSNVRGASNPNALFDTLWVIYHDDAKARRLVKSLAKRGLIDGPPPPQLHHRKYVGKTWWLTALGEEALEAHRAKQAEQML